MRIKLGKYVYYTSILPRVKRLAPTGVVGETRDEFLARMEAEEQKQVDAAIIRSRRRFMARELIAQGYSDAEVFDRLESVK